MGLYLGGFIIKRIFASEIWRTYFREGLFVGGAHWDFTVYLRNLESNSLISRVSLLSMLSHFRGKKDGEAGNRVWRSIHIHR